ncbi:sugar ABC transporter ATP-binding protein [Thermosipho melanesiensis]|uniref:ABC transporter related n=2 Tax=Thermosipho melanesiensis TaxID=46541 RepID=A6LNQ4_THEM4|nr:ABC transporter ATP-binding protein [Thermosipho melanesiensis]ABR31555.1 ABC transporter related [Thermosipho melanesiensis BI429]APT74591.1 glycerol-3-phosphate ABC transporter ATP-binding protein [Thermosipho melanesiensis]OOC35295.1 sugar ABC transporter ATP-binding protein [Thermosipho melanesiensis]OOC35514.1 sugar ABC transporter ATP-binding protein [Thermosipho melanesiensis]OOC36550.1 sugar ABC transporter ATP-binding protein [Thermosipho melanesiensis]
MATLELVNLSKRYGKKVWGAKDVNLKVNDGEFVVFLGPSGCGKTTTLRMIAGLEEVTEGKVIIDGKDVTYLEPRKREVSMVFQSYAVWPHMTVYENIAFPLKLKKFPSEEIDKIVREVAEMVKIEELLKRFPSQLSGGQRQRVALARALAVKPKIFLMDEPLSNLDAKLRVKMRTELKAIHHKTGATTIFVTHDQSEAMSMADRIIIMKNGRIEQVGTPDDVYFNSANVFVAGFIGTPPTNFFEMEVVRQSGRIHLKNEHIDIPLNGKNEKIVESYSKNKIIVGIRPENLLITNNKDKAIFTEKILVVEPQGSHQIIAVDLGEQIVKIVVPAFPKYNPDEMINVTFDSERIMLFDIETKSRLEEY